MGLVGTAVFVTIFTAMTNKCTDHNESSFVVIFLLLFQFILEF